MENEMGYIVAKGPEGLEQVLCELLEHAQTNPALKERAHFILYELGNQKSLIKMDFNERPVTFWHYDLLGRPATGIVKDVLARFVWDKCGEKEWYFKEHNAEAVPLVEESAFSEWRQKFFEGRDHGR